VRLAPVPGRVARAALVLAALAAAPLAAQERIAQLTEVEGGVVVWRSASGQTVRVTQPDERVRNGALFDGDVVTTSRGATAKVLFADCSRVTLAEDSKLSARVVDLTALVEPGVRARRALRSLALRRGRMTVEILAGEQASTEILVADSRVTVEGATMGLALTESGLSAEVLDGEAALMDRRTGLDLLLARRQSAELRVRSAERVELLLGGGSAEPVSLRLPNGRALRAAPGSALEVTLSDFSARLALARGGLTTGDGAGLAVGEGVGYANSEFSPGPSAPVTASTVEGQVEFRNASQGMRVLLDAGFGVQTTETAAGTLRLGAASGNPRDLRVQVGNRLLDAGPGSQLSVRPVCGRVSLRISAGKASFQQGGGAAKLILGECEAQMDTVDAGGTDAGCSIPEVEVGDELPPEEEEEQKPPACGECAVPSPTGGCQDVDALCPDEPCVRDRRCEGGRCVGGRRLTSNEDPNCL
jgi:hypothetical protein